MKHERVSALPSRGGLSDLDALVRAELAVISGRGQRSPRRGRHERAEPAATPESNLRTRKVAKVAPIRPAPVEAPQRSGEEYDGVFDDPSELESDSPIDQETPATALLTAEERAFVTRAIRFLAGREHADIMLGQIWEQLAEEQPDGFYEAPDAETTTSAPAGTQRGSGSDTHGPTPEPPSATPKQEASAPQRKAGPAQPEKPRGSEA